MSPPKTKQLSWEFPISQVRGKLIVTGDSHPGLVDDLSAFVDTKALTKTIIEFYEQTDRYQLIASIKWATWFKPFAMCYKLISKQMQQLNLPISSKETEMTGEIKKLIREWMVELNHVLGFVKWGANRLCGHLFAA